MGIYIFLLHILQDFVLQIIPNRIFLIKHWHHLNDDKDGLLLNLPTVPSIARPFHVIWTRLCTEATIWDNFNMLVQNVWYHIRYIILNSTLWCRNFSGKPIYTHFQPSLWSGFINSTYKKIPVPTQEYDSRLMCLSFLI